MKLGKLNFESVEQRIDLVSKSTRQSIKTNNLRDILVAEINPDMADTTAFCEEYDIDLDISVNCVIVEARRADRTWYGACMVPATARADVNNVVRRELDARKISFAPMEKAVSLSGMEYGGICPIGLPIDWPILVDSNAAKLERAVIGSGVRKSKLLIPGKLLSSLPNVKVLSLQKT